MAQVSAFVGHSFLPSDETVVRKFTDFFDQIAKSHDFAWVHATEPRPDEVASKVLDLIEGRNLFIAICTPNERVAKELKFKNSLVRSKLNISKDDLETKTSDWIIQEIGLAIGRGMKIIILLQNGVRKPGSLQGNIEYISFDRDAIEKSFSGILGMITSLQGSVVRTAETSQGESTLSGEVHEKEVDRDSEEPDDTWDEKKFDFEYFKAVIFKNPERAEVVSEAWLKRVSSNPETRAEWESSCLLKKTRYSGENHLSEIKSISDNFPKNPKIQKRLARAYEHFEDFGRAREHLQISLDNSESNAEKRNALSDLARVSQTLGDRSGVVSAVSKLRNLIESTENEKDLLSTLEQLATWHGDHKMLKLAMMERELEINPSDTQKRFQLAYAHSQNDNDPLSMYHYEKIPYAQREATTWNNLGVAYQRSSLSAMSVSAYQTAAKKGETLAMSNLAELLMSAGFLEEAKNELLRANGKVAHKNVAKSQVRLDSILPDEEKDKAKTLEGTPELSQFLAAVGHCVWQTIPVEIGDAWIDGEVSLAVCKESDRVTASGSYQKADAGNGFAVAVTGAGEKPTDTYDVTITGRFVGSVLLGEYSSNRRGKSQQPLGLFDLAENKKELIAIYDPERKVLRCLIGKDLKEFEVRD